MYAIYLTRVDGVNAYLLFLTLVWFDAVSHYATLSESASGVTVSSGGGSST